MRIVLLAYGSRGDVQPFVALGVGLRGAGHSVLLAAPARFGGLVQAHGLDFTALPGDPDQLSRALVEQAGVNSFQQMRLIFAHGLAIALEVVRLLRVAVQGADMIIHSFLTTSIGHQLASELGVPDLAVQLFPFFVPYESFPNVTIVAHGHGAGFNRRSHQLSTRIFWLSNRLSYAWLRRRYPALGSARPRWPAPGLRTPLLLAYSPLLVGPTPAAAPLARTTGFLTLEPGPYRPPPALAAFLADGPAPVFVGFGSMVTRDAARLTATLLEALRRTGQRGLFQRGWAGLGTGELPSWALAIDDVPHEWLFPQMAAVIHHGGAGTTAVALRAGVPTLTIPFTADQPFWGWRAHQLGVGPPPLAAAMLSVEALVSALTALAAAATRQRAAIVGAALRAENGLGAALRAVELVGAGSF
jgi:sterol 3beta-glucosyltransferase